MTDTITAPAPVAPAAPAPTVEPAAPPSIFSEGTRFSDNWHESLDGDFEPLRPTAAKFAGKDVRDLLKSYGEAQKLIGQRQEGTIKIPGEGATPEEIANYRKALGVPDSPDGYDFSGAQLPEGYTIDDAAASQFRQFAAEIGLPANHAAQLVAYQAKIDAENMATLQQEQAAAIAELRKEWGGEYDFRVTDTVKQLTDSGMFTPDDPYLSDPKFIKAVEYFARNNREDRTPTGVGSMTSATPGNEATAIMTDKSNPHYEAYRNPMHPMHSQVRERVHALLGAQAKLEKPR